MPGHVFDSKVQTARRDGGERAPTARFFAFVQPAAGCAVRRRSPAAPFGVRRRGCRGARRGATIVEMAIVGPLALLLIMGVIAAALGAFRMQQVARLAHEGARWASVRGPDWEKYTGNRPITEADVLENAVSPLAAGLDVSQLSLRVTWNAERTFVTVMVSYRWLPELFMSAQTITARASLPVMF